MIKDKIRNAKGISLISLAIAVIMLVLIANLIIYNVKDNLKVGKLKEMQNDVANLRDKVASYYAQNGKIPASIQYTNVSHIRSAGVISDTVDTGDFLVIELSALENLTLNYGEDYEKIKEASGDIDKYEDLYIINEDSHNIFYVRGITVDKETFYTDYTSERADTKSVDLRYVEGVKIPDGFYYVSGTKETGIVIKSNDDTMQYMWIQNNDTITEVPNNVQLNTNEQEDFIKSANVYKGYYKNTASNDVIYLELEKWSPVYDKEAKYTDKNGDTAYIPKDFQVSEVPGQNTIDEGLVVKDSSNQNEWVWIEVPKSIYTTATASTDYANIEKDMQTYASSYRSDTYTDTWYSEGQHGFATADDYNNYKNNMLKSVYEKGGFYIGRYEVGTTTVRTSSTAALTIPMIQRDAYPYNYVTCKQAQSLSNQLVTEDKTSSLMFGIQWDLVLKFIETKGGKTQSELKTDSTAWGNYLNAEFDIERGQYSTDYGNTFTTVTLSYSKPSSSVLLTTGATERNSTLNIYDLAGNVWEWTLEYTATAEHPCSGRGGHCDNNSKDNPASGRGDGYMTSSYRSTGLRPALY